MKKRMFSALVALVMVLTLLAGCGGSTTPPANTNEPDPGSSGQEPAPAPGSKTLSIALGDSITTLDPHRAANLPSYQVRNMCYDFLIQTNLDNGYSPCLAQSWEFNEEGNEMTLHLAEGVKFHNGEDFTSADVVATFERLMADKTLMISNTYWSLMTGVEAVDEYTVKLVLSEPFAGIFNSLSVTAILPDEAWNQYGEDLFNQQLCYGTGPWIFDEFIDGQYFHVTKNQDYWNKDYFDSSYDEVYGRIVLEASTAVSAMISGDVQAYIPTGGISSDILPMFAGSEDKITIDSFLSGSIIYLGMGVGEGRAFENKDLRMAAMLAIDRQTIVDSIYGGGKVPNSFMPEGTLGYSDAVVAYEYDTEKAKEYLASSGYDGSPIVMIGQPGTTNAQSCLLAISEMWNEIGINSSVEMVESAVLNERRSSGNYDVFIVSSMQEHSDPIKYINQRILNDNHHSGYVNDELFSLIRQSNSEMDEDARREMLETIVGTWSEELVHLQIVQQQVAYAYDKSVSGLGLFEDGMYTLRFVTSAS